MNLVFKLIRTCQIIMKDMFIKVIIWLTICQLLFNKIRFKMRDILTQVCKQRRIMIMILPFPTQLSQLDDLVVPSLSGKGQSGIASGVFPPHDVPKSFTWGMKTRSNKYHAPS